MAKRASKARSKTGATSKPSTRPKTGKAKTGKAKSRAADKADKAGEEDSKAKSGAARGRPPKAKPAKAEEPLQELLEQSRGTASRAVVNALIAVDAVASEKTTATRAQQEADEESERARRVQPSADERRCEEDRFAFFRESYTPPEDDPFARWRKLHGYARHRLEAGASSEVLAAAEKRLVISLPPSYWDFCLEWGRGDLFISEWRRTRFIAATELLEELKTVLADRMLRPYLPVFDWGGGDYLALDTGRCDDDGECPVVWWQDGAEPVDIADSFLEWLERFCEAEGDFYWLEP